MVDWPAWNAGCADCDDGVCTQNCGPWRPLNERFVGRFGSRTVTEDTNGVFRLYRTGQTPALELFGTEERAYRAAMEAPADD